MFEQRVESSTINYRSIALDDYELREDDDNGDLIFEGVASVVDHPYPVRDMWGEYTETIAAGAFNKSINEHQRVSLYVNHNHRAQALATRNAGTLEVFADPNLRVRAQLDPTRPDVQNIASGIRRNEMGEMSIGFMAVRARDEWNTERTEVVRHEVNLRETSIVEAGANTGGTSTSLRALDDFMTSLIDLDMTDEEIRRAIDNLTKRLADPTPVIDPEEVVNEFAERDRADRERLERKLLVRP